MLVGLLPFSENWHISFIAWPLWPGYVYGLQITVLDVLALALYLTLPPVHRPLPFKLVLGLYLTAAFLSIFQAQVPEAAVFYVVQLMRAFFVYIVVARGCSDERVTNAILTGLTIGLCYQMGLAIWQRFGQGLLQAYGTFGQQNYLGLASEFGFFPLFALLLAGSRSWQVIAAPLAGAIIAVLTTSRAAVGLAAMGFGLLLLISLFRRLTARKATVLISIILVLAALAPIAIHSFERRFKEAPLSATSERSLFINAASLILSDHPMGVGANNYVVTANTGGYLTRAGVPWRGGQHKAIVHSAYWLTATECGYFGLIAFILLWIRIIAATLKCGWQAKSDVRGDLLLGIGVSLLVVAAHNAYEWIFMMYNSQYLFAINIGLSAGLTQQVAYEQKAAPVRRPAVQSFAK